MKENKSTSNNYGMTNEVKEELVNLAKQIESGTLGNDEVSQSITNEVAEAIIALAKAVEDGSIGDKQLAAYLAIIMRRLSREKEKLKKKEKQKQKTALDIIMDQILLSVARAKIQRKKNPDVPKEPGFFVKQMKQDLDSTINKLVADNRLESDVNSIRLIEDTIAVNQKVAALTNNRNICTSSRGMSIRLMRASVAVSGQAMVSNLGNLGNLKQAASFEGWSEANQINYNAKEGVDTTPKSKEIDQEILIKKMMIGKAADASYGPNDVPTTDKAKKLKELENQKWEQSMNIGRKE